MLALASEPQRGLCLATETDVECVETEGFHIGYLRCHQSTKICYQFCLHTSGKSLLLANALGSGLQGRGGRLTPVKATIVDEQSTESCATARDVLRARHHLDIHAKIDSMEGREGNNQRHTCFMGDVSQLSDIGHEQLRIGDDLEEQGASLVVDLCLHLLWFREINKTWFHTERAQCVANQRDAVAKQMFRGYDVESCCTDSRQRVMDGRHTRVECRHTGGSSQLSDTFLQIGGRGVGDAGIRRGHGTTAKCVAHGLGRLKLKRRRIVDGH